MIVIACVIVGGRAKAQSAEAEALFNDGVKLLARGQVAQACEAFEASNRAEPRAGTLISLGQCREQNQQLASAWSAYADALKRVKDPRKRAFAGQRVKALEPRLSHLTVSVASRIEGLMITRNGQSFDAMLWSRALPVDGGDYVIVGHAPGYEDGQVSVHVPVEGGNVSVEVPALRELAKPAPMSPPAAPVVTAPVHEAPPPPSRFTTRRTWALGMAGAGVVGASIGIVLGVSARGKQTDAFALCPDAAKSCSSAAHANDLLASGRHRALAANISLGVAAAAVIGAGVLWFTGAPTTERVSVAPSFGDRAASVVVVGRW